MRATLALTALLACTACEARNAGGGAAPDSTLMVTRGDLEVRVLLTGELEASNSLDLSTPRTDAWQLSIRWMAEDGAAVESGARMIEFDNSAVLEKIADYELAVNQTSNERTTHRAAASVTIAEKKFALEQAEIEVAKAKVDADAPAELLSRYEHRQAELALQRAEVALAAAKQDHVVALDAAKHGDEIDEIAHDKALRQLEGAEEQIDALVVTAPRDGVTVINNHPWEGRKFQIGDMAWPGWSVAKLPELSEMVVEAELSDVDDGRIAVGMQARCIIDAFPDRPLPGIVRSVSPVAREPDRNSARRFFSVIIELDETDTEIMRPGLSVQVEVLGARADDSLLVPRAALDLGDEDGTGPRAYLADGSTVAVEVELCNAQVCAVSSGVAEGDALGLAGEKVQP